MFLLFALALTPPRADGTEPGHGSEFDPATGYRIARYRAALPDDAPGAIRIFVPDVEALVKDKKAILLDVMASDGAGPDPVTGQWRLSKTHDHIPGSTWLPDVGKGRLDARLVAYLRSNLERLTGGDRSRAIIIYCQSDCWMSWNAVKRAAALGYTSLYWLPEGTDGWRDWDGRLVPAVPEPVMP